MQEISLENQPNQEFNITLNNVPFRISLRYLESGCTLADIYASDNPVMLGVLCRANEFLIPYQYLAQNGNFISHLFHNYIKYLLKDHFSRCSLFKSAAKGHSTTHMSRMEYFASRTARLTLRNRSRIII